MGPSKPWEGSHQRQKTMLKRGKNVKCVNLDDVTLVNPVTNYTVTCTNTLAQGDIIQSLSYLLTTLRKMKVKFWSSFQVANKGALGSLVFSTPLPKRHIELEHVYSRNKKSGNQIIRTHSQESNLLIHKQLWSYITKYFHNRNKNESAAEGFKPIKPNIIPLWSKVKSPESN